MSKRAPGLPLCKAVLVVTPWLMLLETSSSFWITWVAEPPTNSVTIAVSATPPVEKAPLPFRSSQRRVPSSDAVKKV